MSTTTDSDRDRERGDDKGDEPEPRPIDLAKLRTVGLSMKATESRNRHGKN